MKRTRNDILNELVKLGIPLADSKKILNDFINIIVESIKNKEEVRIKNFGKFFVVKKRERNFLNPKTKKLTYIPSHFKVRFIPSINLKKAINENIER